MAARSRPPRNWACSPDGIASLYIVFQGAGAFLSQIAQRKVLIGLPLTAPVLSSYEPGNVPLPVQFFYIATPYNGLQLTVLKDGPFIPSPTCAAMPSASAH